MVINPNPATDAASLQNSQTPAKSSSRAASADAASQKPSPDVSAAMVFDAETTAVPGAEIHDPGAADQSLSFLQDKFLNQPSLVMLTQANQIPASVLQLLQP